MKHSFHAHHAPMGARGSFLVGLNGAPGGFVAGAGSAGTQDVFVGYRYAGEPWTLLPFVRAATAHAAGSAIALLPYGRYGRTLGWASDRWMAQALVFSIATPFASIEDLAAVDAAQSRLLLTPAAYALLDFDNSHMDVPVDLVFAIGDVSGDWRPLAGRGDGAAIAGFMAERGGFGFASDAGPAVRSLVEMDFAGTPAAGLVFRIPPGGKAMFPIALGFGGEFPGNLAQALAQFQEARALALRRDEELRNSGLADDTRRQVSLATRTRLAEIPVGPGGIDLSLGAMRLQAGV